MKKVFYLLAILVLAFSSCASVHDFNYFQDVSNGDVSVIANKFKTVKVKPYDKISILVTCKDPQLSNMFNLVATNTRLGQTAINSSGGGYVSYYTVNAEGNVDIPIIGTIHVADLSRDEIAQKVKNRLITAEQGVKDATVVVEFADLHIGVLGEVKNAGAIAIDRDQFTILNALEKAGDLTQYGNRKNVKVFRRKDNTIRTYEVDLTNFNELCASPVFTLQQNDIIYVEPNKVRARQSTAAGNALLTPSFWMSVLSVGISVAVLLK